MSRAAESRIEITDTLSVRNVLGLAPAKTRKLCFLDLEHCGFGTKEGHPRAITEFAVIIRSGLPPHKHETWEAQVIMSPLDIEEADPKALEINGYDPVLWAEKGQERSPTFALLHDKIASHTVVGFNVVDDLWHIESEFELCGIPLPRRYPMGRGWCTHIEMVTLLRAKYPEWGKWSLAAACERFGIDPEGEHRAKGGAERTLKIWDAVWKNE